MCEYTGDKPWQENVVLGSWERLESYAHDIIIVKQKSLYVAYRRMNKLHIFDLSTNKKLGFE